MAYRNAAASIVASSYLLVLFMRVKSEYKDEDKTEARLRFDPFFENPFRCNASITRFCVFISIDSKAFAMELDFNVDEDVDEDKGARNLQHSLT